MWWSDQECALFVQVVEYCINVWKKYFKVWNSTIYILIGDSHVKKGGLKYYNAASASRHGQAVAVQACPCDQERAMIVQVQKVLMLEKNDFRAWNSTIYILTAMLRRVGWNITTRQVQAGMGKLWRS